MSTSIVDGPGSLTNANNFLHLDSHSSPDIRNRAVAMTKNDRHSEILSDGKRSSVPDGKLVVSRTDKHKIRGESLAEKPKSLASPVISARHQRRATKPEKPRWQVVIQLFLKAFILVGALWWIGVVILKWRNGEYLLTQSDTDVRLADVERLKDTTKLLKAQLNILDQKIEKEIDKTRKDLTKVVEDRNTKLELKFKKLESRTDKLEKASVDLINTGFISRKEFDVFLSKLKERKGQDGIVNLSLDDIRQFAKEIVEQEIERHAADGIGRPDYALASAGAKILKRSEPYMDQTNWLGGATGKLGGKSDAPKKMLQPSFGEPGQCFALRGTSGFVEIKLRTGIIPEAVTLEHLAKSVAYDRTSAPKHCKVTAWYQGPNDDPDLLEEPSLALTEFTYSLEKSNIQTFPVETIEAHVINVVRLDITSNHGSPTQTCIYRFRVHGREPNVALALQA